MGGIITTWGKKRLYVIRSRQAKESRGFAAAVALEEELFF
jgi:hypothetical protein